MAGISNTGIGGTSQGTAQQSPLQLALPVTTGVQGNNQAALNNPYQPSTTAMATGTTLPTSPGSNTLQSSATPVAANTGADTSNSTVPQGVSNGISNVDGNYTLTGDLKQTYGAGTGQAIANVLANLGTSTDAAVSATTAADMQQAEKGYANIGSSLAAAGTSKDSSTYGLASGDYWSGVNANIDASTSQMELSEENTLLGTLLQTGTAHGSDSSGWDTLGDVVSGASSAAGAISSGLGIGGTAGSILDTIGMF